MKLKKAVLPFLLALLMAQAGCSKGEEFNITGDWWFLSSNEVQFAFTFQGSSEKGTLSSANGSEQGTGIYTVTDGEVVFNFVSTLPGGKGCNFLGTFVSEDRIHGNLEIVAPYSPFNWSIDVEGIRK